MSLCYTMYTTKKTMKPNLKNIISSCFKRQYLRSFMMALTWYASYAFMRSYQTGNPAQASLFDGICFIAAFMATNILLESYIRWQETKKLSK